MKKDRWFSAVSYTDTTVLRKVIEKYGSRIKSYAWIVHDKDEADYHIHFVFHTLNSYTYKTIVGWFRAVQDDDDKRNTFVQSIIDRQGIIDYLTHKNESNEKFKYNEEDIASDNIDDFLGEEAKDESYEILEDMLANVPYRELARKYGRDFIYHFDNYKKLCIEINQQDTTLHSVTGVSYDSRQISELIPFLKAISN